MIWVIYCLVCNECSMNDDFQYYFHLCNVYQSILSISDIRSGKFLLTFWPRLCALLLNSPRTPCKCLISLLAPCSKCRFRCCLPYRTGNLLRTSTCLSPSNLDHQGQLTKCLEHYKVFNMPVCLSCWVGDQNTKLPSLPYLLELKYHKKRKTNCQSKYCSK